MSCELYISLTASDFVDEQVHIHWALSYFKGGRVASFAERILRQELRSGKMCFTSWSDFTEEFVATFCPENEATITLMRLESNRYFQGKRNVEAYIDEFKDLVDLSGYTDDNPNTTQTLEYTKDKYNVKIIKQKVSPKVSPTTYVG
jgi:heme oxygenase